MVDLRDSERVCFVENPATILTMGQITAGENSSTGGEENRHSAAARGRLAARFTGQILVKTTEYHV